VSLQRSEDDDDSSKKRKKKEPKRFLPLATHFTDVSKTSMDATRDSKVVYSILDHAKTDDA
jgi:hypothetical protein